MAPLEFHDVSATMDGRLVLSGITASFEAGKVHAILGERRSGKSSIPLLLAGSARLVGGSIVLAGNVVAKPSSRAMNKAGVGVLFQEASLIPSLSAKENVLAGRRRLGARSGRELREASELVRSVAARWGLRPDLLAPARRLSVIESSVVELVRALAYDPPVLVLDEPAGRFTADELRVLYEIVREARDSGKAVVYIASTVDEVFQVADSVSVMRHGKFVETHDIRSLDRQRLVDWAYSFTESREELFRKNIELLKYHRYSEEIVSNLPIGSVILDEREKIYLINEAAHAALGRPSSAGGSPPADLGSLLACVEGSVRADISRAVREGLRGEWSRVATEDDRTLSLLTFPFHDAAGGSLGTILTVEDITQSIVTQEYLVRAERAASIAELAAGVAHEVNNPLAIISNYVELLIMRRQDDYTTERLEIIRDEIKRIHGIVTSLLSFSAIGSSCLEDCDLVSVAGEAIRLLAHEADTRGVRLRPDFPEGRLLARADPSRIKQILINLVINAIEALADGGAVVVRLEREPEASGGAVLLEVEDDGPGIPDHVLRKLFEPFVRGDKPKPHSGLGLSVCKHIVEAHSGDISCESAPGRTVFSVRLPPGGPPEPATPR